MAHQFVFTMQDLGKVVPPDRVILEGITLAFLPGLILAVLGIYWLAGPITLLELPLAALWNVVIFRIQTRMLKRMNLKMKKSFIGFILYAFIYPLLMQPGSVWGYFAELFGGKKQWN